MNSVISQPIIQDLSGSPTGEQIVPFIDHMMRQFAQKSNLPIVLRDYMMDLDKPGLYFTDFHKEERNSMFYDLNYQSENSLITLIEMILCKKMNFCRQYLSVVHFYHELHFGHNYDGKNSLSLEIRSENGYVKISSYNHIDDCPHAILFKIENGIILFDIYRCQFKLELLNLDQFDVLFEKFITQCYQRKIQEITNIIGRSNMTSKYILERSKMSIYDAIQTTTTQLNIKSIEQLCAEFKMKKSNILNKNSDNTCYKTKNANEILLLTDAILNAQDASFIRQIVSFSQFRIKLSKRKPLVYRLSFRHISKYKTKYSNIYQLSIFSDHDDRVLGDVSINLGDYTNSALLLDFFKAKEPNSVNLKTERNELPEDLFQLMKVSFKQEIAETLDISVNDLVTQHYKLYEIVHY